MPVHHLQHFLQSRHACVSGVVIAKARRTLYSPPPSRDAELARGRDPRITRVEAQHHFAQADQVLSVVVSSV